MRSGTLNVPGIVGMGEAARLLAGTAEEIERLCRLRDRLESGILDQVPDAVVNGSTGHLGDTRFDHAVDGFAVLLC